MIQTQKFIVKNFMTCGNIKFAGCIRLKTWNWNASLRHVLSSAVLLIYCNLSARFKGFAGKNFLYENLSRSSHKRRAYIFVGNNRLKARRVRTVKKNSINGIFYVFIAETLLECFQGGVMFEPMKTRDASHTKHRALYFGSRLWKLH